MTLSFVRPEPDRAARVPAGTTVRQILIGDRFVSSPMWTLAARARSSVFVLALFATLGGLASGCSEDGPNICRVHADCASGLCLPNGACGVADAGSQVSADGANEMHDGAIAPTDGSMPVDDGATSSPDAAIEGGTGACSPNGDGVIERSEIPLRAGLQANFRAAVDVEFDTAGEEVEGGARSWDLSGELEGDMTVLIETAPLEGKWFEDDFPGASYAARLSQRDELLGVFEITDDALLLRGVVSPEEGFTQTLLTYDPPVLVLSFPLEAGDTYATNASVSGTALGVPSIYSESYRSEVDAAGVLLTPFGSFDVLRIQTDLERTVGLLTTEVRTYLFVSECFGTVATITSEDNEPDQEFLRAAEIRRLAP